MTIEFLDYLKREQDISVKPMFHSSGQKNGIQVYPPP